MSDSAALKKEVRATDRSTPSYTPQALYLKIASWSRDAAGYDRHRWEKSRAELLDTVLGSTIKINNLKIDATGLKVAAEGTTYSQVYSLSELGIKQFKGKCRSSADYDRLLEGQGTKWPGASDRMMRFDDRIRIDLKEDSDRLSLELSGLSRVNVTGRLMHAAVCSPEQVEMGFFHDRASPRTGVQLSIRIENWSKVQ